MPPPATERYAAAHGRPSSTGWSKPITKSKTKSKTIAAALAALTLATSLAATSGEAQARPRFGTALGIGFAAGALVGIAATNAYAGPGYVVEPGYRDCRYVDRLDRWGNIRTIKVCDVVPY